MTRPLAGLSMKCLADMVNHKLQGFCANALVPIGFSYPIAHQRLALAGGEIVSILLKMDFAYGQIVGVCQGSFPLEEQIDLAVVIPENTWVAAFSCVPGPFGPVGE